METKTSSSYKVAGIVTYNPDLDRLESNLNAICSQCDEVIIFDNGSNNCEDIVVLKNNYTNANIIKEKDNKGIGFALNRITEKAKDAGAKWVLLLDQDSIAPANMIDTFEKYTSTAKVAIIVPKVEDDNRADNIIVDEGNEPEEVGIAITSGSYINIDIWESIGKFREDFFIDAVDSEYCIRAFFNGYKTLRINNMVLRHELGKAVKTKLTYVSNHNAMRRYHIARNNTYVAIKYQKELDNRYKGDDRKAVADYLDKLVIKKVNYERQIKFAILVLLYEDDKIAKLKAICKGIKDGKKMIKLEGKNNG